MKVTAVNITIRSRDPGRGVRDDPDAGRVSDVSRDRPPRRARRVRAWLAAVALFAAVIAGGTAWQLRSIQLDHDLLVAVRNNDATAVERLLVAGASANAGTSERSDNPVLAFVLSLFPRRVYQAKQQPALITALSFNAGMSDSSQHFPPPDAAQFHVSIIRLLLKYKANPDAVGDHGQPAIRLALYGDYHISDQLIQLLVTAGADTNRIGTGIGPGDANSPTSFFRQAVRENMDVSLITLMLDHGADVNACDEDGTTSLMLCSSPTIMAVLLQHHPDVNLTNALGYTALDCIRTPLWDSRTDSDAERDKASVKKMLIAAGARHGKAHPWQQVRHD